MFDTDYFDDGMPIELVQILEDEGYLRIHKTREFRTDHCDYVTSGNAQTNLCTLDPERNGRIAAHRARIEQEMVGEPE